MHLLFLRLQPPTITPKSLTLLCGVWEGPESSSDATAFLVQNVGSLNPDRTTRN